MSRHVTEGKAQANVMRHTHKQMVLGRTSGSDGGGRCGLLGEGQHRGRRRLRGSSGRGGRGTGGGGGGLAGRTGGGGRGRCAGRAEAVLLARNVDGRLGGAAQLAVVEDVSAAGGAVVDEGGADDDELGAVVDGPAAPRGLVLIEGRLLDQHASLGDVDGPANVGTVAEERGVVGLHPRSSSPDGT